MSHSGLNCWAMQNKIQVDYLQHTTEQIKYSHSKSEEWGRSKKEPKKPGRVKHEFRQLWDS